MEQVTIDQVFLEPESYKGFILEDVFLKVNISAFKDDKSFTVSADIVLGKKLMLILLACVFGNTGHMFDNITQYIHNHGESIVYVKATVLSVVSFLFS